MQFKGRAAVLLEWRVRHAQYSTCFYSTEHTESQPIYRDAGKDVRAKNRSERLSMHGNNAQVARQVVFDRLQV